MFPIITKEIQQEFERRHNAAPSGLPCICGYYGRACRQMEKAEGANRALCMGCPLANFAENIGKPFQHGCVTMLYTATYYNAGKPICTTQITAETPEAAEIAAGFKLASQLPNVPFDCIEIAEV